jgi:hypothetical protein
LTTPKTSSTPWNLSSRQTLAKLVDLKKRRTLSTMTTTIDENGQHAKGPAFEWWMVSNVPPGHGVGQSNSGTA